MLMERDKASYWNLSLKELSFRHNFVSPNILFIKCASYSMVKWQVAFAILAEKLLLLFLWWNENNLYTNLRQQIECHDLQSSAHSTVTRVSS